MKFFGAMPSSASRFFQVQFKDIQIRLGPNLRPAFTGGFLRAVRGLAPRLALFVAAIFCVYCVKPVVSYWAGTGKKLAPDGAGPPAQSSPFYQTGFASWYGGQHGRLKDRFGYRRTANGETMDPEALICAHRTLPFGTIVRVENISNGLSIVLRVVDRGPYVDGRIIDISLRAAREIGLLDRGIAKVRVQALKGLLRKGGALANNAPGAPLPLLPDMPLALNGINLSALFLSLINPIILPKGSIRPMPSKRLNPAVLDIEEIIKRFKNRRLEPFINRKT